MSTKNPYYFTFIKFQKKILYPFPTFKLLMQIRNAKKAREDISQNHKYQTSLKYENISRKLNDTRARKDYADDLKRLARSDIASWRILETVLEIMNKHRTIRDDIVNEIEERY